MNETGEYQLHVLGMFKLERDAHVVKFPRRKAAALFAYLALHPQTHRRDELATLLWGDYPDDEARQSLRTALTAIRHHVGDDVLIVDHDTVRLNPTFPLWVDAVSFETYAKHLLAEPPFDISTAFVDLYEGDLLPDVGDDWVIVEREHLRRLYLDVLLHVTQEMRSRSEYERAIAFARRVLAIEPSNERAHQHIMFCYITMGDRSAALKQYEACRQALQDDLGVEPMPETTALYHWIKGRPAHEQPKEALITNLPIPLSSFVGRSQQMAEVKRLLTQTRLLTLAGPGGSGKTRLAIQVATDLVDAYRDGVWFVDLSTLHDPAQVVAALVRTLRVAAQSRAATADALVAFLRGRRTLLVLDNCEHLVVVCAQLAQELLSAAPQVTILATSHEILDVQGEAVYHVPALSTPAVAADPPSLAALAGFEATRLFIERATAAYPQLSLSDRDSPAVIAVCRQLDGMPLAIELAAARVKILSVGQIADNLRERFTLLAFSSHARPSRQASLRAAIDWSYDLLPGDEQALLRRLSLFAGSFSLAGATAVDDRGGAATLERLARLVDKSLVVVVPGGEQRRYRLLDTIKLYAWEKLVNTGDRDEVVCCYISFVSGIMKGAADRYATEQPQVALRQVSVEYDNIMAALVWCEEIGDVAAGLWMFANHRLLFNHGDLPTLERHVAALLAADVSVPPAVRGVGVVAAGILAQRRGDFEQARRLGEEGLALCQMGGEKAGMAQAQLNLGRSAYFEGRWDAAAALLDRSLALFRELGHHASAMQALLFLADVRWRSGDHDQPRVVYEQALVECRKTKDKWGEQYALRALGTTARASGDYATATALYKDALAVCIDGTLREELGFALLELAACAADQGQAERALILWGTYQAAGVWTGAVSFLWDAKRVDSLLPTMAAGLGGTAPDALVARGRAMTLEQAAAYALSDA